MKGEATKTNLTVINLVSRHVSTGTNRVGKDDEMKRLECDRSRGRERVGEFDSSIWFVRPRSNARKFDYFIFSPFHNVSHSSIFHIHTDVNESRHIYMMLHDSCLILPSHKSYVMSSSSRGKHTCFC